MRGLFFTLAIRLQSASPLYNWHLVRPCMANACTPTSCNRSATSSIFLVLSSQPNLVFTVTGSVVPLITALVSRIIRSMSLNTPAPAPLLTTFFTGHPKLISTRSGFTVSQIPALIAMASSSPPKICMPNGLSSSLKSSFCLLFMASRISPSLLINSLYIRSAPLSLHNALNGGSLTSSIGANSSGKSGNSMEPILGISFFVYCGCKFTTIQLSLCNIEV